MHKYNFMNYTKYLTISLLLCIGIITISCESEYQKMVKSEQKKNVLLNDLVFDMKFGGTKKDFFDRCWELNKEGKIAQGPNNNFVSHVIEGRDSTELSITMLFYGAFNEQDIMDGMKMEFFHNAWAPWNKDLYSDKLLLKVKDSLQKWFPGNDFIPLDLKKIEAEAFVKVDANREIIMYVKDDKAVTVRFADLRKKYKDLYN